MVLKTLKIAFGVLAAVLIAIQFFRPAQTNPWSDSSASFEAVSKPPQEVASSLKRACYDCHSHETAWPWYSYVAPFSWLIVKDVNEGRAHVNFSAWNQPGAEGEKPEMSEVCEQVKAGKMPPRSYVLMHPQAKLNAPEVSAVCAMTLEKE